MAIPFSPCWVACSQNCMSLHEGLGKFVLQFVRTVLLLEGLGLLRVGLYILYCGTVVPRTVVYHLQSNMHVPFDRGGWQPERSKSV